MTNKQLKIKTRRLAYLCSLVGMLNRGRDAGDTFSIDRELGWFHENFPGYPDHLIEKRKLLCSVDFANRFELLTLFKELEYGDKEAFSFWFTKTRNQWANRRINNAKPIKVQKDNPNLYEGEQWRGGGTPRQPRKVRKTAWKRFKKLYPNYIIK